MRLPRMPSSHTLFPSTHAVLLPRMRCTKQFHASKSSTHATLGFCILSNHLAFRASMRGKSNKHITFLQCSSVEIAHKTLPRMGCVAQILRTSQTLPPVPKGDGGDTYTPLRDGDPHNASKRCVEVSMRGSTPGVLAP
jgi:hypothetical protein